MAKLSNKELYSEIIKKVVSKELTQKEAALQLGISDRQVRRLIVKYKNIGEEAFVHKSAGKPSHNKKIPDDISTEIVDDYLTDFSDFGFTHFYEEQGYKYGISFSAMVTIFTNEEIISPYAQHRTVKLYNENMKNAIRDNTITKEKKTYLSKESKKSLKNILENLPYIIPLVKKFKWMQPFGFGSVI